MKMIIFDLGGVLLQEPEVNLTEALPSNIEFELINGRTRRIFNRMFEFVEHVLGETCKRDWLIGKIQSHDVIQIIKDSVDKDEYAYFFKNIQEKNLVKYGSELILLPENVARFTSLNQDGFDFVKRCKDNGLRIAILSNWDLGSFALIKNKFPELFDLFDFNDIIIPADAGFIKPEKEIYHYLIKKLKIDVTKTIFIDDSSKNISVALECGINGIVHSDWEKTEFELLNGCKNIMKFIRSGAFHEYNKHPL